MTTVLHSTKPYGHYLQSYCTDEVVQQGNRFEMSFARYRKDRDKLKLIERHVSQPEGYPTLDDAIAAAEASRSSYLSCSDEEMLGAAEDQAARDYAYETAQPEESDINPFEETSGCNTSIEYFFRTAGNSKQREAIVVAGVLSEREQQELREALESDCFIPEQVGLRSLQGGTVGEGAWHEIEEISITEGPTTFPGTARQLLAKFKNADWDPSVSEVEHSAFSVGGM
jgi:hypothetical protein